MAKGPGYEEDQVEQPYCGIIYTRWFRGVGCNCLSYRLAI